MTTARRDFGDFGDDCIGSCTTDELEAEFGFTPDLAPITDAERAALADAQACQSVEDSVSAIATLQFTVTYLAPLPGQWTSKVRVDALEVRASEPEDGSEAKISLNANEPTVSTQRVWGEEVDGEGKELAARVLDMIGEVVRSWAPVAEKAQLAHAASHARDGDLPPFNEGEVVALLDDERALARVRTEIMGSLTDRAREVLAKRFGYTVPPLDPADMISEAVRREQLAEIKAKALRRIKEAALKAQRLGMKHVPIKWCVEKD